MDSEEDMLQHDYMRTRNSWTTGDARMHWYEERERGPIVRLLSVRAGGQLSGHAQSY
jgi:hypothetical protein